MKAQGSHALRRPTACAQAIASGSCSHGKAHGAAHTRVPLPPPLPPAARKHLFYCDKVDVKPNTIRLRQYNPSIYFPQSFRTIQLGVDSGVQAIIARRLHPRKR